MTTSVESLFGSGRAVGGFFLNNQLTDFSFRAVEDGRPVANAVAPGKRPRSSMSPVIVLDRDGRLLAALGSPGGSAILAYNAKALVGLLAWGLPLQQAIDLPNLIARGKDFFGEVAKFPPEVLAGTRRARHRGQARSRRGIRPARRRRARRRRSSKAPRIRAARARGGSPERCRWSDPSDFRSDGSDHRHRPAASRRRRRGRPVNARAARRRRRDGPSRAHSAQRRPRSSASAAPHSVNPWRSNAERMRRGTSPGARPRR